MWLTKVPFALVSLIGLAVLLGTGYLIIRGPFLGGAPLSNQNLLVALGGFFVGLFVFMWGAARLVDVGTRM
ncbi:MAG: hypothetical protein ABEJ57_02720 [Halobacteriaceae archaeon]